MLQQDEQYGRQQGEGGKNANREDLVRKVFNDVKYCPEWGFLVHWINLLGCEQHLQSRVAPQHDAEQKDH